MKSRTKARLALFTAALIGFLAIPAHSFGQNLSVTVTSSRNSASVVLGGPVQSITVTATAAHVPVPTYPSGPPTLRSCVWSNTVSYSSDNSTWGSPPAGYNVAIAPSPPNPTSPVSSPLTASFSQAGYWKIIPRATLTYSDGVTSWTATSDDRATMPIVVAVVGIDKIQFQLPGGKFQDLPAEGLYVAAGTVVTFKAIPNPAGATWPSGFPIWGGDLGAGRTGESIAVTVGPPSLSMTDVQTLNVRCGNTVSTTVVRYGQDQGTLTWHIDAQQPDLVVFDATYQFWIPDANGDGRPDAATGYAAIQHIDFDQLSQGLLPYPAYLTKEIQWPYQNGRVEQRTFPAFGLSFFISPEAFTDPLVGSGPMGLRRPSALSKLKIRVEVSLLSGNSRRILHRQPELLALTEH